MRQQITIDYDEFDSVNALQPDDRALIDSAMAVARKAYAPYSHFSVGAALRLTNGLVVNGTNQENAAYPSGLCAERTAIFAASAQYPDNRDYDALAIVGLNEDGEYCEASPCGACRQVMIEYEQRQGHPMRVICYINDGRVRVFGKVADLLPFSFDF
ncbi:MAG: cytidine deaminase [Bacteroidales bacterium]|nr:cytidine deaminase [Bacteroidales bacterium]